MANVHGPSNQAPLQGGRRQSGGGGGGNQNPFAFLNFEQADDNSDPRKESFPTMLKGIFCPKLRWRSFTTFILILNFLMFIFVLTGGIRMAGTFLEVENKSWFFKLNVQPDMVVHKGQVWRLVSGFIISQDFSNFLLSQITLCIFGALTEGYFGWKVIAPIYLVSGIVGNIFGLICTGHFWYSYAGASPAISGLLGVALGFLTINWSYLGEVDMKRARDEAQRNGGQMAYVEQNPCAWCCCCCESIRGMMTFLVILIIAMIMMYTFQGALTLNGSSATEDQWYAPLGGLITGWFMSAALIKSLLVMPSPISLPGNNPELIHYDKQCRLWCLFITAGWIGTLSACLWLTKNYH